ncbi:hypothetical protein [Sandaracinus amylolyticus]|uniref:hypothetical protein n=1 Tax=Sandaracinus amylolyticus TaxID=927083 RepID=UPI001F330A94|nr:hypothetical protein [Sandaracinus amylolyticus]UJR82143.1 Hypothetical protein I5071_42080 [Sandaracinus amylolyticus]
MSKLRITLPDGSELEAPIVGRTTIGTSASAGVRLPADLEIEGEHLLLVPREDGCWISVARNARTPVLRDGAVLQDATVPWGARLVMGGVTLEVGVRAGAGEGSRVRTLLLAMVVGIAALLAVAVVRNRSARAESLRDGSLEPSALFDAPGDCADAADARTEGAESLRVARARGERFRYDYQDGIAAVSAYSRAEQCFLAAGAVPAAERAQREGHAMREEIEGTYRRLRLSLQQSLDRGDDATALDTLRELRELTHHRRDDYTAYLAELERELQLDLGLLLDDQGAR